MLTHRALFLLRLRSLVPTRVVTLTLLAATPLYVAAWAVAGDTGATLCLLCNVLLAVGAWPLYRTLGGLVTSWRRLHWWQAVLLALLYVAGYLVPPVVIVRGLHQANQARRAALAARPGQIAALERELGMPPS